MNKYQATDAFGTDHKVFISDRININFTYVIWAEGSEIIVGKGFETFKQAQAGMKSQLRKFDKHNLGAAGQVREVVAL